MVILLMQYLLTWGFKSVFNFFIAWARTQRVPVIHALLEGFSICSLYKFGDMGCHADNECFDRFIHIAENLGIVDAILYRRCRVILCASRNIDSYFSALDALTCSGHYMYLVAKFIIRSLYRQEASAPTIQALVGI